METTITKILKKFNDAFDKTNFLAWLNRNKKSLLKDEKEQMIDFHIEVMKSGLIEEGGVKWTDSYLPKIKETANKIYEEKFKK